MNILPRESGFTLLEVIIALVIGAIIMTMGVPSFTSFIQNNRMTTQINDFVSTAHIARSEAVKRGLRIGVCKSKNGTSCNTSNTGWEQGWIAFVDIDQDGVVDSGDTVLAVKGGLTEGTTLIGDTNIDDAYFFNPNGTTNFSASTSLVSYGELVLCDSRKDDTKSRALSITAVGRLESIKVSDTALSC